MRDMTAHTVYVFLSLFPAEDWVKQYHEMYHSAFVLGICEFNNLEIVSLALFSDQIRRLEPQSIKHNPSPQTAPNNIFN